MYRARHYYKALPGLSYLVLTTPLRSRSYAYPQFTERKTETQNS